MKFILHYHKKQPSRQMKDLAFHISDIVGNSIRAGARNVGVSIELGGGTLTMTVSDDGPGIDRDTAELALRTPYSTRKNGGGGCGLPLLVRSAEGCGGGVTIDSQPGKGAVVKAVFVTSDPACPPKGDVSTALMLLMTGSPGVNLTFRVCNGSDEFAVSTADINGTAAGIPPGHPIMALAVRDIIAENTGKILLF